MTTKRAAKVVRHGNPTNTAWLRGWDAGITGQPGYANPYSRRPQKDGWDRGHASGLRSSDADVLSMKNRTRARSSQVQRRAGMTADISQTETRR